MSGIEAGLITGHRPGSSGRSDPRTTDYHYRDPARCSPARLAALEARDRAISLLDTVSDSARLRGSLSAQASKAEAAERHARFAALREDGWGVAEAGARVGIAERTACRYEQERLRPPHEPGLDCPNAPHTCLVCEPDLSAQSP